MSPGEWIAFGALIFTLISAGIGMAMFVGRKVMELVRHLDRLDAGVAANTAALGVHGEKLETLSRRFDGLQCPARRPPPGAP